MVSAYHSSCIVKGDAIGEPKGELVSDFDLLDRYADKDMFLSLVESCVNDDFELSGIQFTSTSVNNYTLPLSQIGSMQEQPENKCKRTNLLGTLDGLRAYADEENGVTTL